MILAFFGGILCLVAVWLVYHHRVSLANHALTYIGPHEVTIRNLEVRPGGKVIIEDLLVKYRVDGREWLKIPELAISPGWRELAKRRIGEIKIQRPELKLDESLIKEWMREAEQAGDVPQSATTAPYSFYLAQLEIDDALIRWDSDLTPAVELGLSYRGERITREVNGELNSGIQTLEVYGAKIKPKQDEIEAPMQVGKLSAKGLMDKGWLKLSDLELNGLAIRLMPEVLTWLQEPKGKENPGEVKKQKDAVGPAASIAGSEPLLKGVNIERLHLQNLDLQVEGFTEDAVKRVHLSLPDLTTQMNLQVNDLHLDFQDITHWQVGEWSWQLENFSWAVPGSQDSGYMKADRLFAKGLELHSPQDIQLQELRLVSPEVKLTDDLFKTFSFQDEEHRIEKDNHPQTLQSNESTPTEIATTWQVHIGKGSIEDGKLQFSYRPWMDFDLSTELELQIAELSFGSHGWGSSMKQILKVEHGELKYPVQANAKEPEKAKLPFLELPCGELVLVPDAWQSNKTVEKLVLQRPKLRIRDGNTPWGTGDPLKKDSNAKEVDATVASKSEEDPIQPTPWWQALNFRELTLNEGVSDWLMPGPKSVEARGTINIHTSVQDEVVRHHLRLQDVEARLPTLSRMPFPVAKFSLFEGSVRLPQLWTEKRIDSVRLEGANLEAGKALMSFVEQEEETTDNSTNEEKPTSKETAPVESRQLPKWMVGRLDVEQSSVTIVNLVPGLPAVKFNLEFHAEDSPLMTDDLTQHIAPQKVEVANLIIPSPYEPLRPVAELDNIFVHFTLQGLMNKRIDRVEIISPTLFVGEDLFWYVDYYRQYVNQGGAENKEPLLVSTEEIMALKAANVLMDSEPTPEDAAWSIGRLQVHSGKLILAPKGRPLKGFGKPLPFNINTEVVRGTLEAELEIPPDVYTLTQYKLQFEDMHGKVHFNLPLKQKDNNLVETFEVDRIRWKELQTGKAFLSITYDKAGIYARFGAEAYEGYVNGELNIYNDETYSWDGWISGKNLQTDELTRKLFPSYFFMQGKVEATLVAQGNMHELFQADGTFKNHTPGKFSITALNDAVKNLPGDWTALEKQLTQIGLETLRDFEYDDASAEFRLYGREGEGQVRFTGPHGSRNFDINVYDHRWTAEEHLTPIKKPE